MRPIECLTEGPGLLEERFRPVAHSMVVIKTLSISALLGFTVLAATAFSQSPYQSSEDFAKYAMSLHGGASPTAGPRVVIPTSGCIVASGQYPWKMNIVTTVFWVGERAAGNNPVPNFKSSWDPAWESNYGGFDTPASSARRDYMPVAFVPRKNPFYIALPYNDVTEHTTKPEACNVIPWFRQTFERPGKSVCQHRWVAIRCRNKVVYAQWEDCGPFCTDNWEYVFGNKQPKPNLNGGAGLDVSPAVRDYLGIGTRDVCDWKFVEARDVPPGPWSRFGHDSDVSNEVAITSNNNSNKNFDNNTANTNSPRNTNPDTSRNTTPSQFLHQFTAQSWTAVISRGNFHSAPDQAGGSGLFAAEPEPLLLDRASPLWATAR